MGARNSKDFCIDRSQVEWTIFYSAQGTDILATTTRYIQDLVITPELPTLELFRIAVQAFIEDRPRELPYIAAVCAYAIKIRKKYHLSPWGLADVIFTELNLPWIIVVD